MCLPQLLGRAESVKDFVRKGFREGSTEIHLSSGGPRPIIITRQMNSEDGTSKWLLNRALQLPHAATQSSDACFPPAVQGCLQSKPAFAAPQGGGA